MKTINHRKTNHDVNPIFPSRWSPRAMTGEPIEEESLWRIFEAARWAPSSYNNQPWRFLYSKNDSSTWETFFNLLAGPNQVWAKNASVLIVVVSQMTFDPNGDLARTHSFDAGAAWENLALQTTFCGLVSHAMQGFDYDRAKKDLKIPEDYSVEAMIAIGKPAPASFLPEDLQEYEKPNDRKPLKEIVCEGSFDF